MRVTTIPNHKLKTISKTDSVSDRGRRKGQGNNNTRGKMTWGKLVLREEITGGEILHLFASWFLLVTT